MDRKWKENGQKIEQKLDRKLNRNWAEKRQKMVRKWTENGQKMDQKWTFLQVFFGLHAYLLTKPNAGGVLVLVRI